jgi:hypothetical protein
VIPGLCKMPATTGSGRTVPRLVVGRDELKHREVDEVGAGRSELEEVLIDALAVEHALGVGPEIDLIAGEEDRRVRKDEEFEI